MCFTQAPCPHEAAPPGGPPGGLAARTPATEAVTGHDNAAGTHDVSRPAPGPDSDPGTVDGPGTVDDDVASAVRVVSAWILATRPARARGDLAEDGPDRVRDVLTTTGTRAPGQDRIERLSGQVLRRLAAAGPEPGPVATPRALLGEITGTSGHVPEPAGGQPFAAALAALTTAEPEGGR
ncbi:hypothetical protein AB0H07_13085 [Streptomyces sp. NPDC021354]|uniref:hypothetical protein n=1 Tax=Streptomyces sp. NPDC021354 TaxID=3154793 RepID=UPI0033E215B2